MNADIIRLILGKHYRYFKLDPVLDAKYGTGEMVKDPTVFEWFAAVATNTLPWEMIPEEVKLRKGIEIKDTGIDSASMKVAVQTKNYAAGSSVSHDCCAKFMSSYQIWRSRTNIIVTPPSVDISHLDRYKAIKHIILDATKIEELKHSMEEAYLSTIKKYGYEQVNELIEYALKLRSKKPKQQLVQLPDTEQLVELSMMKATPESFEHARLEFSTAIAAMQSVMVFNSHPKSHKFLEQEFMGMVKTVSSRTLWEGKTYDLGILYRIEAVQLREVIIEHCHRIVDVK